MFIIGSFFQAQNSSYPVTRLCPYLELMCYVPRMDLFPLSLSPPRDSPARAPCLQKIFPRVHLSLLLLPPLRPFFRLFAAPPVAPVVTRRPPVRLTGGRCHAAPGFLASVPMFGGLPPPTCAAGGTWLGFGWRDVGDDAPPMFLRSSMRCRHTDRTNGRSIFGALE